jgi:hypothetical protein
MPSHPPYALTCLDHPDSQAHAYVGSSKDDSLAFLYPANLDTVYLLLTFTSLGFLTLREIAFHIGELLRNDQSFSEALEMLCTYYVLICNCQNDNLSLSRQALI